MFQDLISSVSDKITTLADSASDSAEAVLEDYSNYSHAEVSDMLWAIILGVVIGFLISLVYIFTHRKGGYSQSYVLTVLVLPPIVSVVLVLINSTAAALSLAGVFTLCRYRTIPADPKDVTYVFFAMASGVICGICDNHWIVFIFFIIMAAVLILVEVFHYGQCKSSTMTLKITIPENLNYAGLFDETLNRNTTNWKLRRVKTTSYGSLFELVYVIQLKDSVDQKTFIDDLRKLNGNLTVILSLFKYEDMVFEN